MKKKTLFLSIALLIVLVAQHIVAEIKPVSYPKFIKAKSSKNYYKFELSNKKEDTLIYAESNLDVKPEYPGGVETYKAHVNIVLKNPKNIKGDIFVAFIVEKNGSLSRVAILKGIDEETDKEILKVLKESPKWKSGEKEGQKVRCLIPLFITINGSK